MARKTEILTWNFVKQVKTPGYHHDGRGLYLRVTDTGGKSWAYRYWINGRLREMGLGAADLFDNLEEVREKHTEARRMFKRDGVDPIEARKAARLGAKVEAAKSMTFRQCAEAYISAKAAGWRNPKHAAQWPTTLAQYVYPVFGELPVAAVDVGLVMKVLEPIWTTKRETASRVRGRIESVLDWATARDYRKGENPARWRGHLESLLAPKPKVEKAHLASLSYSEMGEFMTTLRAQDGVVARALEFTILTAARTGEVRGAKGNEIVGDIWTIPAGRMKGGNEHRVPLSKAALAVLPARGEGLVFRPLKEAAMRTFLRRLREGPTVHGFRSTFSTWAADQTSFSKEIREAALAHKFGDDETYRSYQRSDLLERRRELMEAWARFCGGGQVLRFPSPVAAARP